MRKYNFLTKIITAVSLCGAAVVGTIGLGAWINNPQVNPQTSLDYKNNELNAPITSKTNLMFQANINGFTNNLKIHSDADLPNDAVIEFFASLLHVNGPITCDDYKHWVMAYQGVIKNHYSTFIANTVQKGSLGYLNKAQLDDCETQFSQLLVFENQFTKPVTWTKNLLPYSSELDFLKFIDIKAFDRMFADAINTKFNVKAQLQADIDAAKAAAGVSDSEYAAILDAFGTGAPSSKASIDNFYKGASFAEWLKQAKITYELNFSAAAKKAIKARIIAKIVGSTIALIIAIVVGWWLTRFVQRKELLESQS